MNALAARRVRHFVAYGALLVLASCASAPPGATGEGSGAAVPGVVDVLIVGGEVVDGTGAHRRRADVAVAGDTIVAVGRLPEVRAKRVIDARGRIVAPGFIDLHAHVAEPGAGDLGLLSPDVRRRAAQNFVAQGVTTTVANPDGRQADSLAEQRARLERLGVGPNVVLLNGHGTLRAKVMGADQRRPATDAEIRQMRAELRRSLEQEDSFGLSLGTEYFSGRHASLQEQVELARELPAHGAILIAHIRSQGIAPMWYRPSTSGGARPPTLDEAVAELVAVAEESDAVTVFTHMKAWGPGYRGQAERVLAPIEAARARGARIYMDVYPYDSSSSDGQFVALPPWSIGGDAAVLDAGSGRRPPFDFRAALDETLRTGDREALRADVLHQFALKGGPENVRILGYRDSAFVGKSFAEMMREHRLDELELAIRMQRDGDPQLPGGARMRAVSMDERDIIAFYSRPWTATASDAWIVLPEEATGELKFWNTNQRCFGTFPRRIAHYSLTLGVDTLEQAIRSASGLPAEILGLADRGRIAVGAKADLVVLNLPALADRTSIMEPSVYPSGVEQVLVNGQAVVSDGERTLALPGRVRTHWRTARDGRAATGR